MRSWASAASLRRETGLATGRPSRAAVAATWLGASFRPRPAGRSGWVRTRATWCVRARASSAGDAKAGVPAKTTRKATGAPSGSLALALLELGADAVLLEIRQQFHEDLPAEVVHLVLDAGRQHARRVEREARAVTVEGGHGHAFRTLDVVVDARNRKAALLVHGLALAPGDLGVDEHAQVAAILAHVDDDDLLVDVDLAGREPDAGGGVHGFGHVVDQLAGRRVDFLDPLGGKSEAGVGVLEDLENGHKSLLIEQIMCRIYRTT